MSLHLISMAQFRYNKNLEVKWGSSSSSFVITTNNNEFFIFPYGDKVKILAHITVLHSASLRHFPAVLH